MNTADITFYLQQYCSFEFTSQSTHLTDEEASCIRFGGEHIGSKRNDMCIENHWFICETMLLVGVSCLKIDLDDILKSYSGNEYDATVSDFYL